MANTAQPVLKPMRGPDLPRILFAVATVSLLVIILITLLVAPGSDPTSEEALRRVERVRQYRAISQLSADLLAARERFQARRLFGEIEGRTGDPGVSDAQLRAAYDASTEHMVVARRLERAVAGAKPFWQGDARDGLDKLGAFLATHQADTSIIQVLVREMGGTGAEGPGREKVERARRWYLERVGDPRVDSLASEAVRQMARALAR